MSITAAAQHSIWAPSVAATSSTSAASSPPASSSSGVAFPTGTLGGNANPFQQMSSSMQATLLQIQGDPAQTSPAQPAAPNSAINQSAAAPTQLPA